MSEEGREGTETSEECLFRELNEEIDISLKDFVVLAKSNTALKYNFLSPIKYPNGNTYTGQIKIPFIVRL